MTKNHHDVRTTNYKEIHSLEPSSLISSMFMKILMTWDAYMEIFKIKINFNQFLLLKIGDISSLYY